MPYLSLLGGDGIMFSCIHCAVKAALPVKPITSTFAYLRSYSGSVEICVLLSLSLSGQTGGTAPDGADPLSWRGR